MSTQTTKLALIKPEVNSSGRDVWGNIVNSNFDKIDNAVSSLTSVAFLEEGDEIQAEKINVLTDSATYTLPAASSVAKGQFIVIEKAEKYKDETPTVLTTGSDLLIYSGGTDTGVIYDSTSYASIRFVSNGVDGYQI